MNTVEWFFYFAQQNAPESYIVIWVIGACVTMGVTTAVFDVRWWDEHPPTPTILVGLTWPVLFPLALLLCVCVFIGYLAFRLTKLLMHVPEPHPQQKQIP